jgi:predicted dehydrogenase
MRSWWTDFDEGMLRRERQDPLLAQFEHFLQVASEGALPRVSARDGYRNMKVLEAIGAAVNSGRVVDVLD